MVMMGSSCVVLVRCMCIGMRGGPIVQSVQPSAQVHESENTHLVKKTPWLYLSAI